MAKPSRPMTASSSSRRRTACRVAVQAAAGHAGFAPLPQQPVGVPRPRLRRRPSPARGSAACPAPGPATGSILHPSAVRSVSASSWAARAAPAPAAVAIRSATSAIGGGAFEPPLSRIEAATVDGPQQAGRVQHVGEPVLVGVGVADRVGQHGRDAEPVGQGEGAARRAARSPGRCPPPRRTAPPAAAKPPRPPAHATAPAAARPRPAGRRRGRAPARRPGRAGRSVPRPACSASAGQGITGEPPAAWLWAADTRRHSRAQPARFRARSVTRSGGSATWAPPRTGVRRWFAAGAGAYGATAASTPKIGRTPCDGTGVGEADVPGDGVPVGERHRRDAALGGAADQVLGVRGAVARGEAGGDVQVYGTHRAPPPRIPP